jgi:outer membrane lipoprotein-sorting protein
MNMMRILMVPVSACVLCAAMTLPAAAQKLSLAELSNYLNDLKTAKGAFTQVNDDGSLSTGQILLKRPGRVRFEYDPPEEALVVADGDTVGIIDPRSNEKQGYPLHRTPLKIILARNVDLTRARMVVGHGSDGTSTTVRAQDPENPEYGSIDLVFTGDPVELRQWVINDGNGSSTTVILGDLQTGIRLDNDLFEIPGRNDRRVDP